MTSKTTSKPLNSNNIFVKDECAELLILNRFELDGDAAGSQGASSQFEGRVVVLGAENNFYSLEMSSSLSGQAEVKVLSTDYQVMLVVASVPEFFGSYQTYGYQVKITKS